MTQRRGFNPVEQVAYPEGRFKPVQPAALADEDAKPAQRVGSPTEGGSDAPIVSISSLQNKAATDEFSVGTNEFVQQEASPKKSSLASSPTRLCSRVMEKSPEKSSSVAKKKVSFNSVVIMHEPVPSSELLDREEFSEDERTVDVAKPNRSNSDSETGSKTSSLVSYVTLILLTIGTKIVEKVMMRRVTLILMIVSWRKMNTAIEMRYPTHFLRWNRPPEPVYH